MSEVVLLALAPVVLLIALGHGLRRQEFLAEAFWPQAERLGYYVLLPALFLHGLATAQVADLPIWQLTATLVVSTLIVAALVVALRPVMAVDGPAFTSVFQGSVRFNNYVGVTLAAGLFGTKGIALAAICNAAIVPTVNVLCVLVFARHGSAQLSAHAILRQLATNPLVVSCLAGILMQAAGASIPPGLEPALRVLGAASLPLGLLCVGAALEFGAARRWLAPMLFASAFKFAVMPLATIGAALSLDLKGPALTTAILFQGLPTASSAYIMARQLGGDAPMMAGVTAAQTVLAAGAIPLMLGLAAWLVPI
ncbi:AEC family transporter [Methylobacterium sp. E-065]|uniref:AEC family transporter n=1 Tax=Methylobacterium sp. E-065 TaxID=2836583 RepID=UPI001FBB869C|nr:AEC family transporter [Methylobacterium sp. E-065]MCJ2021892.1 AEC family transporter [Methylobacterium sp. E-065]